MATAVESKRPPMYFCIALAGLHLHSLHLSDSKYWSLIKEWGKNSDTSVKLLNSSVLAKTSESIKPQTPGEPQLATWSSIKFWSYSTASLTQSLKKGLWALATINATRKPIICTKTSKIKAASCSLDYSINKSVQLGETVSW